MKQNLRISALTAYTAMGLLAIASPAFAGTCATSGGIAGSCTIDNTNPPVGSLTLQNGVILTVQQNPTIAFAIDVQAAASATIAVDTGASPIFNQPIGATTSVNNFNVLANATPTLNANLNVNSILRLNGGSVLTVGDGVVLNADIDGSIPSNILRIDGASNFEFQDDVSGTSLEFINNTVASTNGVALGQNNTAFAQDRLYDVTIDATSRFEIDAQVRVFNGQTVTNNGTLRMEEGGTLDAGQVTNNGTIQFSITTSTTGQILTDQDFTVAGADIEIIVDPGNSLSAGDEILLVDALTINAGAGLALASVTDDSGTFDFEIADGNQAEIIGSSDATQLWLLVSNQAGGGGGSTATGTSNTNTQNTLQDGSINALPQITEINTALTNSGSQQETDDILDSTNAQQTMTGSAAMALQLNGIMVRAATGIAIPLATSGGASTPLGQSTGEEANPAFDHFWLETYGTHTQQDRDGTRRGYNARTYGFNAGMDSAEKFDDMLYGFTLGVGRSELDGDDPNNSQIDTNFYGVGGYIRQNYDDGLFSVGMLNYQYGRNESVRSDVGGIGLTARADYDSHLISTSAILGRDFEISHQGWTGGLSPYIGLNYAHLITESYTETGAGNASLSVDTDSLNRLETTLGLNWGMQCDYEDGSSIAPFARMELGYEWLGEEIETTSRFAAGGPNFNTVDEDPEQFRYSASLGMTYDSGDNWHATLGYSFDGKSDYQSHSGQIRVTFDF